MKKQTPKVPLAPQLTMQTYRILSNAVEDGVRAGVKRVWKHRDQPELTDELQNALEDIVHNAVMCSLGEVIQWPE